MNKYSTALTLCAALAVTLPAVAFAQTAAPETAAPETAPAAEPTAPAASNSIDEQLSFAETEVGKPYTRETIGAWEMRCLKVEQGEEPCQMYQLLDDGEGAPIAEVSMFRLPAGGKAIAGATIIVPLETALNAQFSVQVDGDKARRYPYSFCNPVGCYVRLGLTAADVAAFKRGKEATMVIVPAMAPDQKIDLKLSLAGFTASYDKVSVLEQ